MLRNLGVPARPVSGRATICYLYGLNSDGSLLPIVNDLGYPQAWFDQYPPLDSNTNARLFSYDSGSLGSEIWTSGHATPGLTVTMTNDGINEWWALGYSGDPLTDADHKQSVAGAGTLPAFEGLVFTPVGDGTYQSGGYRLLPSTTIDGSVALWDATDMIAGRIGIGDNTIAGDYEAVTYGVDTYSAGVAFTVTIEDLAEFPLAVYTSQPEPIGTNTALFDAAGWQTTSGYPVNIWGQPLDAPPAPALAALPVVSLTMAEYDALDPIDPDTIYDITDADWMD